MQRHTLIGVFGTPSTLTYWGIHLVRTIAGVVQGEYEFVHGHYRADFVDARARRGNEFPLVCVSDCPEVEACRLFVESGGPIVIFVEDPANIIDDMVGSGAVDNIGALRLAARSLCAIQPLLGAPGAIIFRKACLERGVRDVAHDILAALDLGATDAQKADIDRLLSLPPEDAASLRVCDHITQHFPRFGERHAIGNDHEQAGAGSTELVPEDAGPPIRTSVRAVANLYNGLVMGEDIETAEWPSAIFSCGDRIGDFVSGPNELLGPARILIYGPYMHLPRGDWSCYVELEVSGNESGNQLKVDLVSGPETLASILAELPIVGRYSFSMRFRIREPLEPIELRFQIESGAIEGRFLLSKVVMTREALADAGPERLAAG